MQLFDFTASFAYPPNMIAAGGSSPTKRWIRNNLRFAKDFLSRRRRKRLEETGAVLASDAAPGVGDTQLQSDVAPRSRHA